MDCFKCLGTILSSDLGWENNTDAVVKKAQQRLFFLRQLKKFGLRKEFLVQFYRSGIESILTFSLCVWFGGISQRQRSMLHRVVKTASKMFGSELTSLKAILSQTKLTPPIICSNYYRQANVFINIRKKTNRFINMFTPVLYQPYQGRNIERSGKDLGK